MISLWITGSSQLDMGEAVSIVSTRKIRRLSSQYHSGRKYVAGTKNNSPGVAPASLQVHFILALQGAVD